MRRHSAFRTGNPALSSKTFQIDNKCIKLKASGLIDVPNNSLMILVFNSMSKSGLSSKEISSILDVIISNSLKLVNQVSIALFSKASEKIA